MQWKFCLQHHSSSQKSLGLRWIYNMCDPYSLLSVLPVYLNYSVSHEGILNNAELCILHSHWLYQDGSHGLLPLRDKSLSPVKSSGSESHADVFCRWDPKSAHCATIYTTIKYTETNTYNTLFTQHCSGYYDSSSPTKKVRELMICMSCLQYESWPLHLLALFRERPHLLSAQMRLTYFSRTEYILLTSNVSIIWLFVHMRTAYTQKSTLHASGVGMIMRRYLIHSKWLLAGEGVDIVVSLTRNF